MIVFGIHWNFFIVLPIRFFPFLQGKMCSPEKLGATQSFCATERTRSASSSQLVQAFIYTFDFSSFAWNAEAVTGGILLKVMLLKIS